MKAFINGRRVFGTPVQAVPPVYPSLMVSIPRACVCALSWKPLVGVGNVTGLHLACRSISSILRFSPRGRWLQTTAAAASVARSATLWKTAPCAKSRDALVVSPHQLRVCNDRIHPGLDPSRGGTRREGPSTSESERITAMMAKTRPGRRTSTGGRETHRRCAAASCAGQAATSRGTVSWTGTLQVADVSAGNRRRGGNSLWLISLIFIWQEIWRWKTSLPPPLRLIWGIWGSWTDRYMHAYLRGRVWMSLKLLLPHWFCFWGVLFWKWSAACLHDGNCFNFSPEITFTRREKEEEATKSDIGSGNRCVLP